MNSRIQTAAVNNFVLGLSLGLGAALPIGPVNVEIARRTLSAGFRAGFALGCGAVTVDVTYAVLSSFSFTKVATSRPLQLTIGIAGFALLVYLGMMSLKSAATHLRSDPLGSQTRQIRMRQSYVTGLLMTLLNPMTLIFWFVALPGLGINTQDSKHALPMICAGVFIGTLGWVVLFSGFLGVLGRWRGNWWLSVADATGGVMMLALAVRGLWHLYREPL